MKIRGEVGLPNPYLLVGHGTHIYCLNVAKQPYLNICAITFNKRVP